MDIAVYAWHDVPSSHYRAYQPMLELSRRGHEVTFWTEPEHLEQQPPPCDVAYIARYKDERARRLVAALRDAGTAVVWDCDDDVITTLVDGNAEQRESVANLRATIPLVDLVTTTNDTLADRFLDEGAPSVLALPNYLAEPNVGARARDHEGLVLGWIAWLDHQADWDQLGLADVMTALFERHEDLVMEMVGPLELGLPRDRLVQRQAVPFEELGPTIAGFDIGIAPLSAGLAYNVCRSDIKLKEYGIAGVPWLASGIGPYRGLGEQEGGRLVADDAWFDEIDALIRDRRARRKLAKQGRRWAQRYTLAANYAAWEDMLFEAVEVAAERRAAA